MATDRNPQNIDAAALDREIDHEIRRLRKMGHDTPGICEASREITERCRERLIAGKSLADFDLPCGNERGDEYRSVSRRSAPHRQSLARLQGAGGQLGRR